MAPLSSLPPPSLARAAATLVLVVGAVCFYRRRSKGSEAKPSAVDSPPPPKLVPLKARPEEEATVISVAPEAEETLPAQLPPPPATGWFAAEPEGEAESFAPEAEKPPPPGSWFSGAAPEPEPFCGDGQFWTVGGPEDAEVLSWERRKREEWSDSSGCGDASATSPKEMWEGRAFGDSDVLIRDGVLFEKRKKKEKKNAEWALLATGDRDDHLATQSYGRVLHVPRVVLR